MPDQLEQVERARREALDALDVAALSGKELSDQILAASVRLFEARALKARLQGHDAEKEFRRKTLRAFLLADWAAGRLGLPPRERKNLRERAVLEAGMREDDLRVIAMVRHALLERGIYLMTEDLEREFAASDGKAHSLLNSDASEADAVLASGFVPFREEVGEAAP